MKTMTIRADKMEAAALGGFTNATDLADYLVRKGIPFRSTHEISGKLVHYSIENNKSLNDLTLEEFRQFSELIDEDIYDAISLKTCVSGRTVTGGPAEETVKNYLDNL